MRITRLRITVPIAMCCLLTSTATASAECAWVLWPTNLRSEFKQFLIVYDGRRQCEADKANFINKWDPKEEEEKWGFLGPERHGNPRNWVCLPDTMDPRGPRGK